MNTTKSLRITLGLVLIFSCLTSFGQEAPAFRKNAVYQEIGGVGGLYSINFERRIINKKGKVVFLSAGYAVPFKESFDVQFETNWTGIPLQINWSTNKKCKTIFRSFEAGLSLTPSFYRVDKQTLQLENGETATMLSSKGFRLLPGYRLGYRYEGPKGLIVRAGVGSILLLPVPGLSVGYSF